MILQELRHLGRVQNTGRTLWAWHRRGDTGMALLSLLARDTGMALLSLLASDTGMALLSLLASDTGMALLSLLTSDTGMALLSLLASDTGMALLAALAAFAAWPGGSARAAAADDAWARCPYGRFIDKRIEDVQSPLHGL